MQIINVVEIVAGVLTEIYSFPILSPDRMEEEKKVVQIAEDFFIKKAIENGLDVIDEDILDNCQWDNNSGYEIIILWSSTVVE